MTAAGAAKRALALEHKVSKADRRKAALALIAHLQWAVDNDIMRPAIDCDAYLVGWYEATIEETA